MILPLRNPVLLAKELATIDVLSQGRLEVGIGVGYVPGEYDAIGVPFETRGRRADEWIDALRTLWRDEQPELRGEFASFGGIQCRPQPHRPGGPPIIGSGMATAARRRCVERCDGWYGFYLDLDNTKAAIDELDRLADEVDRPAELGKLQITVTPVPGPIDADIVRRYEDLGVDRLVVVQDFGDMAGGPDARTPWQVPGRDGGHRRSVSTSTDRNGGARCRATKRSPMRSMTPSPERVATGSSPCSHRVRSSGTTTTATTSTPATTWLRSTCSARSSTSS